MNKLSCQITLHLLSSYIFIINNIPYTQFDKKLLKNDNLSHLQSFQLHEGNLSIDSLSYVNGLHQSKPNKIKPIYILKLEAKKANTFSHLSII